jgi:hypothetical protein
VSVFFAHERVLRFSQSASGGGRTHLFRLHSKESKIPVPLDLFFGRPIRLFMAFDAPFLRLGRWPPKQAAGERALRGSFTRCYRMVLSLENVMPVVMVEDEPTLKKTHTRTDSDYSVISTATERIDEALSDTGSESPKDMGERRMNIFGVGRTFNREVGTTCLRTGAPATVSPPPPPLPPWLTADCPLLFTV